MRISYWAAAISDFSIAILVLIPERMGLTEIEYPMGLASAIAFSWGVIINRGQKAVRKKMDTDSNNPCCFLANHRKNYIWN